MHASATVQTELLTEELRKLPGKGALPMRLVQLPILCELANVDDSRLTVQHKGSAIRSYLEDGINTIGAVEVEGNLIDEPRAIRCLRLTLLFEGRGLADVDERRKKVLQLLGSKFPLSQMRRHFSPEWELLHVLAAHLVSQSEERRATS
jgi:hypothetical protein